MSADQREFLLVVRRALLLIVAWIETKCEVKRPVGVDNKL